MWCDTEHPKLVSSPFQFFPHIIRVYIKLHYKEFTHRHGIEVRHPCHHRELSLYTTLTSSIVLHRKYFGRFGYPIASSHMSIIIIFGDQWGTSPIGYCGGQG